jgi:hypothetical protein
MSDKWEMCLLYGNSVRIWSPGKPVENMGPNSLVWSRGKGVEGKYYDQFDSISILIDEGWEPFAGINRDADTFIFKRKLDS